MNEIVEGEWNMTLNEATEHLDDILQPDKKWKCEECKNEHIQLRGWMNELKNYKELEEQGKLLKLPCAVGDTVYTLNPLQSGKIVIGETTADAFMCALGMLEGRFGKTIFLTQEAAEVALKEL